MQTPKPVSSPDQLPSSSGQIDLPSPPERATSHQELTTDWAIASPDWISPNWLPLFRHSSQLLVAAVEPETLALQFANDAFYHLMGLAAANGIRLSDWLSASEQATLQQLYRRHLLHLVLRQFYQLDAPACRVLDQPVLLCLGQPETSLRYIQVWWRSHQLQIWRLNPQHDEFSELGLSSLSAAKFAERMMAPGQMQALEQQLALSNYKVEGQLWLEGVDITAQETVRQITQLLIDQDSILQPQKFEQVNLTLQRLFRANSTVIFCLETDQIRLFTHSTQQGVAIAPYAFSSLQQSCILRAIESKQILTVPDLATHDLTACEQRLLELGGRSVLLVPLVVHAQEEMAQSVGVVAVLSDRPYHFDELDCRYAEQLMPAFTTALTGAIRQMAQQRLLTNIHPAVEWRFAQEAERRSWGLPPEPVIFTQVYPIYGISDIRGSSAERNRAIQTDLLEQFRLGLAIVEAVCETHSQALVEQLRLDLQDYINQLQAEVTVDAEVSGVRYLRDRLEIYFDYFTQCGPTALAAVNTYRAACDNENQCIYQARARYDHTLTLINTRLRATWEEWQVHMQKITPHYCDIEATDGIDHMIYAGSSMDPNFSIFHLRSLRYEQLRAVCACARTGFQIQVEHNTDMAVTHLVLIQDATVDIFHDEKTERLFDVRGSRDTRYEIVKKRIEKAVDQKTHTRITQPGMLTLVYSTEEEWREYHQYLRYLMREGWVDKPIELGAVEPLQGVTGLKFARVRVLAGDQN